MDSALRHPPKVQQRPVCLSVRLENVCPVSEDHLPSSEEPVPPAEIVVVGCGQICDC